jgi:mannose-6-phosphate isomerase
MREFGTLPFLYKLLAAAKPLSVQAHPNRLQAEAGFERENRAGLAPGDPARSYKDPNHKPEILCALGPFRAMCGFREPGRIRALLETFARDAGNREPARGPLQAGFARLRSTLEAGTTAEALRGFLRALFDLSAGFREALGAYTREQGPVLARTHPQYADEWRTAAYFARLYPADPAVISPLYLNLIRLEPGEAIYLPAGVLHAYIEGLGVELMANSDNVLRGGLTPKHVDLAELVRILEFAPFSPDILGPPGSPVFTYPTACREFSLTVIRGSGAPVPFPKPGPGIVLVTQGRAVFSYRDGAEELILEPGESAFIVPREKETDLCCSGDFVLHAAGIGGPVPAV